MTTISDAKNWCIGTTKWLSGWNNFKAIKDVWNGEYQYNYTLPSHTMKVNQTATEILHCGLKWLPIGITIDKKLSGYLYSLPEKESFRHQLHQFFTIPPFSSNFYTYALNCIGAAGSLYTTAYCIKEFWKIPRLGKIYNNDFGEISFSFSSMMRKTAKVVNVAAIAAPTFLSYCYGKPLTQTLLVAPGIHAVSHLGNSLLGKGFKATANTLIIAGVAGWALNKDLLPGGVITLGLGTILACISQYHDAHEITHVD